MVFGGPVMHPRVFHGRIPLVPPSAIWMAAWVAALLMIGGSTPLLAAETEAPADSSATEWGYAGQPGVVPPERWGRLPDGQSCGRGHKQSPIALYTSGDGAARRAPILALLFAYRATALHVQDNGRFISVLCDSAGAVSLASEDHALLRVDVHAPSEHSLDGHAFPMELEFVHRGGTEGPALIVSVFVQPGQKNAALDGVIRALPKNPGGTSSPSGVSFDPSGLLPADHTYLDYLGSLSSPPCTEGVRWCVLRSAIEASQEQLDRYARDPRLAHSSRPVMPTNSRPVRIGGAP
jgi:carbonic anhydrase